MNIGDVMKKSSNKKDIKMMPKKKKVDKDTKKDEDQD